MSAQLDTEHNKYFGLKNVHRHTFSALTAECILLGYWIVRAFILWTTFSLSNKEVNLSQTAVFSFSALNTRQDFDCQYCRTLLTMNVSPLSYQLKLTLVLQLQQRSSIRIIASEPLNTTPGSALMRENCLHMHLCFCVFFQWVPKSTKGV